MATASPQIEPAGSRVDTSSDGVPTEREVSLAEYLKTVYEPDCDFIDGHLEERNLGEFDHADLQSEIFFHFRRNAAQWGCKAVVEARLQVRPSNFRVPDLMVLHPGQTPTQIIRDAPLLCAEILSPDDTWKRLKRRVDDYVSLGVRHIWVFDPPSREAYLCDEDGFHRVTTAEITVPGTPISLNLADIFAILSNR